MGKSETCMAACLSRFNVVHVFPVASSNAMGTWLLLPDDWFLAGSESSRCFLCLCSSPIAVSFFSEICLTSDPCRLSLAEVLLGKLSSIFCLVFSIALHYFVILYLPLKYCFLFPWLA